MLVCLSKCRVQVCVAVEVGHGDEAGGLLVDDAIDACSVTHKDGDLLAKFSL